MKAFDIVVIGAGAAGLNVASFMNRVGLKILLIERSDATIGGDCLNFGCIPSKALIHVSRLIASGKEASRFGLTQHGEVDLAKVMAYIKERQEKIREHENAAFLREKGITIVFGEASFTGKRTVAVGGTEYWGRRIVIATGSRPRMLDIPGTENSQVYTNETIFSASTLPKSLIVVGGGPIGFEIGQSFARLGAKVTIVNQDGRWLPKEERGVVALLMEKMVHEGVTFIGNAEVSEIRDGTNAIIKHADGRLEETSADALFLAVGRELSFASLEISEAGIETDERGKLVLDRYLRTTNKYVFAAGDAVGRHFFTHAAEMHASLIISNFFKPRFLWKKLDVLNMAWVTFTDPEIATFGRNAEMLSAYKIRHDVIEVPFYESDRAITDSGTGGLLRLYVTNKGIILGGTMVGKDAGELVSELILAMKRGLTLTDVFSRIFPYPTAARINKIAAAQFLGGKLTPCSKRLLRLLY